MLGIAGTTPAEAGGKTATARPTLRQRIANRFIQNCKYFVTSNGAKNCLEK